MVTKDHIGTHVVEFFCLQNVFLFAWKLRGWWVIYSSHHMSVISKYNWIMDYFYCKYLAKFDLIGEHSTTNIITQYSWLISHKFVYNCLLNLHKLKIICCLKAYVWLVRWAGLMSAILILGSFYSLRPSFKVFFLTVTQSSRRRHVLIISHKTSNATHPNPGLWLVNFCHWHQTTMLYVHLMKIGLHQNLVNNPW